MELREATVAIIGLGLMGGSLGLALDAACATRIGFDADEDSARRAVERGAIDEACTLAECAARADILVLALPVGQILAAVPRIAPLLRDGAVVTDLGSTKVQICAALDALPERVHVLGGHPMCGSHQSGIDAATADLFAGATWALTPSTHTTTDATILVTQLVRATGATPLTTSADAHDAAVAVVSHAPYVLARALVASLADADAAQDALPSALASTGFASATRMARGSAEMWTDILRTNREPVRAALALIRTNLDAIESALDAAFDESDG